MSKPKWSKNHLTREKIVGILVLSLQLHTDSADQEEYMAGPRSRESEPVETDPGQP